MIERYGGTVEKFIGDAVMAVWGAPVAQEDDAERAVRAALELLAAVPELDPDLRARAGVLTGEAAVTLGASAAGHGRRRSRQHRLAHPVRRRAGHRARRRVDEARHRGRGRLRGRGRSTSSRARPSRCALWRALRVVAGAWRRAPLRRARGAVRRARPRAPAGQGALPRARRTNGGRSSSSSAGIAGIGKSRLAWEFEKYIDGLAADIVLAPRPLPLLRRGRRLLGARRDGADALRHRRGRGRRSRRARS